MRGPAEGASAAEGSVPAAEPVLVFVHIPKTAGTTMKLVLDRRHPERVVLRGDNAFKDFENARRTLAERAAGSADEQVWAVRGHFPFSLAAGCFPDSARFVTTVRDPIERALSHYYLEAKIRKRYRGGEMHRPRPEDILALAERRPVLDNVQVRMLCDTQRPLEGAATREMLEQAKRNVTERFAFVGITGRFDESLLLLGRALGWPASAYESAKVADHRPATADLPAETVELVRAHNELDLELCAVVGQRFEAMLGAQDADFSLDLAALRLASRGGDGSAIEAEPEVTARADLMAARRDEAAGRAEAARARREQEQQRARVAKTDRRARRSRKGSRRGGPLERLLRRRSR